MTDVARAASAGRDRCLRVPRPLRAADLPARADGGLRHRWSRASSRSRQPLQRHAAGLDRTACSPIGMTFVILTAGIDLSVGSLLAFAGLVAAAVSKGGLSNRFTVGEGQDAAELWLVSGALAAIAVGLLGGFIQGFAITRLKVPPFVVTLGGMSVFRGAALLFAGGGPISGFDPGFVWWGQGAASSGHGRAGPGHHLPRLRGARPHRAALHALRPAGLCGRRQSGGGAALRPERPRASRSASTSSWASSPASAPSCFRRG